MSATPFETMASHTQDILELDTKDEGTPGPDKSDRDFHLLKSRWDALSIPRSLWTFRRVALINLAVYTGYMCEGFELSAGGSIIANAGFIEQFGTRKDETGVRALDPTWLSLWSALLNVGQMVTLCYIAWLADRFGRKATFLVAWLWLVVGCILLNVAKSPGVWAVAKLCNGAGIGVLQIICQVYAMEISPNRIRGCMITFSNVWSGVGGIVTSLMMQQLNTKHPDNYLIAMRVIWGPIGIMGLCWAWIPESPWYHARRGNEAAALKALKRLYSGVTGMDLQEEYGIIVRTIEHERAMLPSRPRYIDVFKGLNLKRTMTVMILAVAQQGSGLAIIGTYSTYFFSLAGLKDPFLGSLILSCTGLISVIFFSVTTDRLGRRTMVTISQTLICLVLFTVGGLYWTGATSGDASAATGLLVVCSVWNMLSQVIGMSYSIYAAELPSALLRVRTGPITFVTGSLAGIIGCFATPPMLLKLNLKSGFIYTCVSVPVCILMWCFLPETKGRSAAEIDELYEKQLPAWRWSREHTEAGDAMQAAIVAKGLPHA